MKRQQALWTGRFQPPTIAHLATVTTILEKWDRLTIIVSVEMPAPSHMHREWADYILTSSRTSYGPGKNPFSGNEILDMWTAGVERAGLSSVVNVATRGRPEFDSKFIEQYPADDFDFVLIDLGESSAGIDQLHQNVLPRLHGRPVFSVQPTFKLHNSEIRRKVYDEGHGWEEFLPSGVYDVFQRIEGSERVQKVHKFTKT